MLEVRDLGRRPIAREHDLFMPVEEGVERVEKFLLRALFAAEELNVVDQQQIGLPVAFAKFDQVIVLDGVDEFVDEKFARKVHHLRVFLFHPDVLPDRLHQVRLAESHPAVNEERVVSARGRLRDRETGGVRDLVIRADHERFESIPGIEPERGAGLLRVARVLAGEFLFGKLGQNLFVQFPGYFRGGRKFHRARRTKSAHNRGLQGGHVITLDPELIDVVRNAKSERIIGRIDELHGGEPALESVRADLRLESGRQFLPELSALLVHTDLLTGLSNLRRDRRGKKLRGES